MKKFLAELSKSKAHLYDALPTNTEAEHKRREMHKAYAGLVGRRALHVSKIGRGSRVVTIVEASRYFVRVSYKYYGRDYQGEISTCIAYQSMLCGDDKLEVE